VKSSLKKKDNNSGTHNAGQKKSKTKKNTKTDNFINQFRKDGINYLNKLTETQVIDIIKEANDAFFNDKSIITDSEYDIIKEYTEKTYPKNSQLQDIGAPVVDKNKVELPYYMGSMDKIKPDTGAIDKWKIKYNGPYVISAKLDGVSGLYSTENGIEKLYTRGNGKIGQDISYFIPYLRLPRDKDITIRGEFIINRNTFEEKYKDSFSNPRNFVSGLINSKTIDVTKFNDVKFVAYEVITPILTPHEQMKLLEKINVENVIFELKQNVSNEDLSTILVSWRNDYKYESDGIIVTNDKIYERENKNPDHSFAFKMVLSEQIAEAKVVDIIWNVSKDGLLKPKVQIEPVKLGGATIQFATGHNAATVVSNKLGVGAIIKIIRSGDVIPYIMDTIVPAETVKMPDVEYVWNNTNIDIELVNKSTNKDVLNKNITGFFTGIKVDGLSSGNITRIINTGYNSVSKIIKMTKEDFLKVEGFKEKLANKLYNSIHSKLVEAELYTIMTASNIFGHGFGEKKMKLIMTEYPDVMTSTESETIKIEKLTNVKGMAKKTAKAFIEHISLMIQFLDETQLKYKLSDSKQIVASEYDTEHVLYAKSIVFTGIREKTLMETLENKYNVKLSSSVSKNTFAIIAKSKDEDSGKLSKARSLNIPIYEIAGFKEEFKL
jgi:NAD-dependent DNA ligase